MQNNKIFFFVIRFKTVLSLSDSVRDILFAFLKLERGMIVLKIESDINILHCRTYKSFKELLNHFC